MEKFNIRGEKTEFKEEDFEATDRNNAALMYKFKYPEFSFDYVGDDMIVAWCENSGLPIFEGDEYETDENGVSWFKEKS